MASLSRKLLKTLICKTDHDHHDDDYDDDDDDVDDDEHLDDDEACTDANSHTDEIFLSQMAKTCDCVQLQILGVQLSKNADQTIQQPISAEMESQNSRF